MTAPLGMLVLSACLSHPLPCNPKFVCKPPSSLKETVTSQAVEQADVAAYKHLPGLLQSTN